MLSKSQNMIASRQICQHISLMLSIRFEARKPVRNDTFRMHGIMSTYRVEKATFKLHENGFVFSPFEDARKHSQKRG
jgi:hypothetical protein